MREIRRIIFAAGNGISRAPMAAAILKSLLGDSPIEVLSRGIVVQFPEPLNQKAEAVLAANGLAPENFTSRQLKDEEITDRTVIFTMDAKQREDVISGWASASADNTFVLSSYVGEELETMDPYGGTVQTYGLCFEMLKGSLQKLVSMLNAQRESR